MDKVITPSNSMAFAVIASSRGTIRGYSEPQPTRNGHDLCSHSATADNAGLET